VNSLLLSVTSSGHVAGAPVAQEDADVQQDVDLMAVERQANDNTASRLSLIVI